MHELSIAQSILTTALNAAEDNAEKVTGITLQIGVLSGIEITALEFAFSIIKKDTLLSNAELIIESAAGEAVCKNCGNLFPLATYGTACNQCNCHNIKILKGREMKIINLIVEE